MMSNSFGSETQQLLEKAEQYCFRARLDRPHYEGPVFTRGRGSWIWDADGKAYLDYNSGQLCAVLGHSPPEVVSALERASQTLIHSSSTFYNEFEIRLAERLSNLLPDPLQKCLFALSGSDASEAAINIAKKVTGRYEVASPHLAFHGLSDTPRAQSFGMWHKGSPVGAPGTYALFAPECRHCPIGLSYPDCRISCLTGSLQLLDAETTAPLAAIITEPVFSAGGVVFPPEGWLKTLRQYCSDRGVLLILDESQTGLAKTGTMWAFEREGIVPDVITVSKHFGGGVPISAVVTSADIEREAVDHNFQYAHSHSNDPLACLAALAVLDSIENDRLVERGCRIEGMWLKRLGALKDRHDCIADVRGRGVLHAIELQQEDSFPGALVGRQVFNACLDSGLLFSTRRGGAILRFTLPFTTTEDEMDQASEILDKALVSATETLSVGT